MHFFAAIAILAAISSVSSVPFVTKRVSLHNPITIDFSGWRPLRDRPTTQTTHDDVLKADETTRDDTNDATKQKLDDHFLTVPVAVETDAEHVLSESELDQIRERVIENWRQKPLKSESFPHLRPFVEQLLPKPEVEREVGPEMKDVKEMKEPEAEESKEEYTFVKMDKKHSSGVNNASNASEDNLFHAYFAPRDHVPPEGYVRMSKQEFKHVFKNAEILFV